MTRLPDRLPRPDFAALVGTDDRLFWAGAAALLATTVLTVVAPPTILSVPLGVLAVVGLARSPRLGVLGAVMLAVLAIPHGRASDNDLSVVMGFPLRFHDGAIAAAIVLALASIRRPSTRPAPVRLAFIWLAVGGAALVVGLLEGNAVRDIVRDARWWLLLGIVPLAFWTGTPRQNLLRALLAGATLYAILVVATAVLPPFDGGLKARALIYDSGLLRLQFNNNPFVVFAAIWVACLLIERPRLQTGLWLTLLVGAVLLSVTRMAITVMVVLIGLAILLAAVRGVRQGARNALRRLAIVGLATVIVAGVGIGLLLLSQGRDAAGQPVNPVQRILFQDPSATLDSLLRGRGSTYLTAWEMLAERPGIGLGLGTLVEIEFSAGGTRQATPGLQPGVDNAWITVGLKAGMLGALVFAVLLGWPLVEAARRPRDRHRTRFTLGWLALLALTMSQSFTTMGYGPLVVALLLVVLPLRPLANRAPVSAPYGAASPVSSGA